MSPRSIVAVYPGSFDPLHLGHVDIVRRAAGIFPHVLVAVLENTEKKALLSVEERVRLAREALAEFEGVRVTSFHGLLVDFMRASGARIIVRGMRAVSDFEYEFQLALMNRRLWGAVDTVMLTPNEEFVYLSSRVIKEIWTLDGDISGLVPEPVRLALAALRARS